MKKIHFILILIGNFCLPQQGQTEFISTTIHISSLAINSNNNNSYNKYDKIQSFRLKALDSLNTVVWESENISNIEEDDNGFYMIVDIPTKVSSKTNQLWCRATILKKTGDPYGDTFQTVTQDYGGVKLSKIKLNIISDPKGAESYLIPNRLWKKNYENKNLSKKEASLIRYKVNTSNTDTVAIIDETVYVVVCKYDGKFKIAYHNTKPYSIESEQTVSFNFK